MIFVLYAHVVFRLYFVPAALSLSLIHILLALTRYYAGQAEITADEKKQLQIMVNILLESEMVFPYMKDLGRFVSIPEDIMDKTMIEYRGDKNVQPWIEMRILPQEDHFTREEMKDVYKRQDRRFRQS